MSTKTLLDSVKKYLYTNKKQIIHISIVTAIIFLVVLMSLSSLNIYSKAIFFLKWDVLVSLQIPQKHVFTDARTPQNISILLNVDNQLFCSASCQYSLIEQSNNSLIDSAMFVGKNGYRRNLTYTIVPPKKGSGQINYQFRAECTNTKTFFCQSPELKRVQSSSITLSY